MALDKKKVRYTSIDLPGKKRGVKTRAKIYKRCVVKVGGRTGQDRVEERYPIQF